MKSNKYYPDDSFDFFKKVRNSKRNKKSDPEYKSRLNSYDETIKSAYSQYDTKFKANDLTSIPSDTSNLQDLLTSVDAFVRFGVFIDGTSRQSLTVMSNNLKVTHGRALTNGALSLPQDSRIDPERIRRHSKS